MEEAGIVQGGTFPHEIAVEISDTWTKLGAMRSASRGDYVHKVRQWLGLHKLPLGVRKVLIGIVGGAVVLVGCALLVLPGPAFIVIPVGLLILASEFSWAKRMTHKASDMMRRATNRLREKRRRKTPQTAKM